MAADMLQVGAEISRMTISSPSSTEPSSASNSSGPLPIVNVDAAARAGNEYRTMLTTTRLCSTNGEAKPQPQSAGDLSGPKRRLFVDHLERNVNEAVLLEVFKQYGQVQEISLFRDAETCSSTGAGYVTFMTTDDALSAMEALDGKTQLAEDGQCLVVEWALGSSGTLCTREQEQQRERRARTLFFAKIPPNVSTTEIENLFKAFGDVNEVNLFKAWAGAKSSKGCGLVEYATREGAERAIDELHQKYCWLNTDSPMVVEWMNQSKQRSAGKADGKEAAAKAYYCFLLCAFSPGLMLGVSVGWC